MHDVSEHKQTETELLAAVESVMQDTTWLSQKIVERMATVKRGGKVGPGAGGLRPAGAPARVLALIAQGLSDDEIAAKLGITRNTVRNHVSAIYGGSASASEAPSSYGRGSGVWGPLPSHG